MARISSAVRSLEDLITASIFHANDRLSFIDDPVEHRVLFNDYECRFSGMVHCLNCVACNTDRFYYLDMVGNNFDGRFAFGYFIGNDDYPLISR